MDTLAATACCFVFALQRYKKYGKYSQDRAA